MKGNIRKKIELQNSLIFSSQKKIYFTKLNLLFENSLSLKQFYYWQIKIIKLLLTTKKLINNSEDKIKFFFYTTYIFFI